MRLSQFNSNPAQSIPIRAPPDFSDPKEHLVLKCINIRHSQLLQNRSYRIISHFESKMNYMGPEIAEEHMEEFTRVWD